ncbi:MAG: hypothetical protein QOD53_2180 [Thermoleophilaceae bacterium]|jgi:hypothetical protein|nr:hypothetical protein [Thermoleophilaceae bacterium]
MRKSIALLAATALIAGCGSSGSKGGSAAAPAQTAGGAPPLPTVAAPSRFTRQRQNAWLPLRPGAVYRYRGKKDGKPTTDVVRVTAATRTIGGVRCTAVSDNLYSHGRVIERTTDWYAPDSDANVWYFGEDTAELNAAGKVTSTEGSWLSGVHGAKAGLFMPADPRVGQTGLQEFLQGHAEDHYRVVSVHTRVRTPGASAADGLLTEEWTPLEPGVLDHKFYVRGVGNVLEQSVRGPKETNELVSYHG